MTPIEEEKMAIKLSRYNLELIESAEEIPSVEMVKLMAKELLELKYGKLPYEEKVIDER